MTTLSTDGPGGQAGGHGGAGAGSDGSRGSSLQCCEHHNVSMERWWIFYCTGAVLVLGTWISNQVELIPPQVAEIPALLGAVLLAAPLLYSAFKELRGGQASTSTLVSIAIIAAIATGSFVAAGLLAFILLFADQVVRQRAWTAERAIEQLVGLTPDTARVIGEDGGEREVGVAEVRVGDRVRVRPGENLPVDGEVVEGRSTINQASLTGEAMPHEVQPGEPVYAGTTNLSGAIEIRVTQIGEDTTIGKVSQLIREAEQSRSPKQLLIEQVSRFYVPVTLAVSLLVWYLTKETQGADGALDRAIAVLVVACPSALLLATPTATVAAFASAARLGIMIKKSNYLEAASGIDTVIFDKTGTLTTGQFAVSKLVPAEGVDGADLLQAAADGEQHSNHPLAKSIVQTASAARIVPDGSSGFEELHGRGIRAQTNSGEVCVGRGTWLAELFPQIRGAMHEVERKIEGMSGVHVVRDGRYLGVVGLEDKVRPETKNVLSHLRDLGVKRIVMLTGDRLSVAERVGRAVGVDEIEAECHPEEKHDYIERLVRSGRRVLMVGDGINDGPSLAAADVGVAMGMGGSDIATNSAGVALMNNDLTRIPFLVELSRRTRAIISQNIVVSVLVSIIGLVVASLGGLEYALGAAALLGAGIYHVVGDVFVFANSFRLFRFGETYADTEDDDEPMPIRRTTGAAARPDSGKPAMA